MELTHQKRVELERLLLLREAAFARIHDLEARINVTFGDSYPMPAPPDLPSMRKPAKKRAKKKKAAKRAIKIRPLQDTEVAYKLCYQQGGNKVEEQHLNPKAIDRLIQLPLSESQIRSVDTINDTGEIVERLWPEDS
ncbi:hypothetical protein [Rubellicoccus peritrichatus]|uniref:Uncharacterized protein n=1 Tax=Rubellicoccus peritrichatus TaxID=3080537 RepID=A0AAQ3LCE9_9BACT|nr:hypothetical protein [Puniceicoccus sp. CR14]WOO42881.1 hypothetical protein RZN69_07235 [Puniceicoccus sp. CR14]